MNEMEMLEWSNPVPEVRGNPGPAPLPVDAEAPLPLSPSRRPWRSIAIAAAVVTLAGGAVAITTIGDDASTDLDATAMTQPGELVEGGPWRVLADDPDVFGTADVPLPPGVDPLSISFPGQTIVWDVIATGDGMLAVGQIGAPNQSIGAVWQSPDGRTWERIDDEVFGRLDDDLGEGSVSLAEIRAIAEFDGVVVAAGSEFAIGSGVGVGGSTAPNRDADLWRRGVDGVWRDLGDVLPIDAAVVPPDSGVVLVDVVATDSGFVLAGAVVTTGASGSPDEVHPLLWHSVDGSTWTDVARGVLPDVGALSALASSASTVVAVGSTDGSGFAGDMAAWSSTDGGLTWSAAETERGTTALAHSSMTDVVATPDGFVAVGVHTSGDDVSWGSSDGVGELEGDVDLAVWTSEDGRRWIPAPTPVLTGPDRNDRVVGVEALPGGRVVVAVETVHVGGTGATTLVGPPEGLVVVADSQPFVFQSLAPGLVPGQVIAGTSPPIDLFDAPADPAEIGARAVEGAPGALFVLDVRDLPAAAEDQPTGATSAESASGDHDGAAGGECADVADEADRVSEEQRRLQQLRNRATRVLEAAGFDVVTGSIGEFIQACDGLRLELGDEVTVVVHGDVAGARRAVEASFPGEPIVVAASELSSEEWSTAVPRVLDALANATEAGLVPDGVQIVGVGSDVFPSAHVLVELTTVDIELLSDMAWADVRPAADALAAELSEATGLRVAVERATLLPTDD